MSKPSIACVFPLFLLAAALPAQVVTSTLYGVVNDPSGAAIGRAKVTATNEASGASVSALTGDDGEFAFSSLQAGPYTIEIEAQGFQTARQTALNLASGARVRQNYTLQVGSVTTALEVVAAAPMINAVNAEQRTNLEIQQIRDLPVPRRDWTNMLNLNTGAVTRGGSVVMNGLAAAAIRVTIDGTDSASDSEQASLAMSGNFNLIKGVSLEAIDEVNVAKGVASAEIANTVSGNININTRRGTNEFHGSLFHLNNTENYDARNQFLAVKPAVAFNQFGGSLGGPVVRNKLFAFGVFEGYRLRGFNALNGNVPTADFRARAIAAVPAYKNVLDLFPLPNTPVAAGAVTGVFQGAGTEVANDNHAVIRGDYHVTPSTIVTSRYTRGRPVRQIPRVVLANFRTWSGTVENGNVNVTHSRAGLVSETRFGYNYNLSSRIDNIYTLGVPAVGGGIGFNTSGETITREGTNWSIEQVFGKNVGRHSLRFGALFTRLWASRDNVEVPVVQYANVTDFLANQPNFIRLTFGVDYFRLLSYGLGFFLQDDFKVSRRLVLNLGLRHDYFSVPNERTGRLFNRDAPYGSGPFRPADSIYNADRLNFSPRLGFAYTLDDDAKTVVRGGAGVFHSPLPMFAGPVDLVQNAPDIPFRSEFSLADIQRFPEVLRYPVFNDRVVPIVRTQGAPLGGTVIDPDYRNPMSFQWTFGVQRQILRNLALETAYVGTRGKHIAMIRQWNQPDRTTGIRPNPRLTTYAYRDGGESTKYHSWQTSLRKRFEKGFGFNVNYTWARTMSYTRDGDLLQPTSVQDVLDVRADYGRAGSDLRHRFAADFVGELPLARLTASQGRIAKLALGGWQINGIFLAQTGDPVTITHSTGLEGSRADHIGGGPYLESSRETLMYLNRGAFAAVPLHPVSRLPIRPGNAGRNAINGPGWWNIDLNLAKSVPVTERLRAQFRVEMLNALNKTNFSGISSEITAGNFGRFTSTRGSRSIQLAARLNF